MSSNDNNLYEFGSFSFDAEERVLSREGKPLPLTPKTLELLHLLIKNQGRIVEKEKVMSEVWTGSFVEESNLTFTVRQLRKALGDDAREPTYIETVPRRGYRFIADVRRLKKEENLTPEENSRELIRDKTPAAQNSRALLNGGKNVSVAAATRQSEIETATAKGEQTGLDATYHTRGDLPCAAQILDEAMRAAERSDNNLARSIALVNYGRLKFAEGDYVAAKLLYQESLRLREEPDDNWGLVQCLEPLTAIAVSEGNLPRAAKLLGAIDVLLDTLGATPIFSAKHEPSLDLVRAALDEKTYAEAFAAGRRLSVAETVKLALEDSTTAKSDFEFFQADKNSLSVESIDKSQKAASVFAEKPRLIKPIWALAAVLISGLIVTGFWYAKNATSHAKATILTEPFASEMLSTSGKVFHAVISSDGKNVIYTTRNNGKESVWLRQLESTKNIEIISASNFIYYGIALSPDGNFLYFVRRPDQSNAPTGIFRVSIFGGIPQKILEETQGWINVSPDGKQISFVRCFYREDENCSLWIADAADGKNERKLASRPSPFRIGGNKFAPDGKRIVFAAGQSENLANEFGLTEIDLETGFERELLVEKFFDIKGLEWLPESENALLFTARKNDERTFRIWLASLASGKVEPLTKDLEIYSHLSLDSRADNLVSIQLKRESQIRLFQMDNLSANRILADAVEASFAPDGKIVFSSEMGGNQEIWSINAHGSKQQQLTNDSANDTMPVVSPDNHWIFFTSNRTGEAQIWRMNTDGGNEAQITRAVGGFPLSVSPDGRWLYFHHGLDRTLWRVSTTGGEEQMVLNKSGYRFAISPDGLLTAFFDKQNAEDILTIASLKDTKNFKNFPIPNHKTQPINIAWSHDGKNLIYILSDPESKNNILWLQSLKGEKPKQIADLGDKGISHFALSPDEESFIIIQGEWKSDAVLLKGLK